MIYQQKDKQYHFLAGAVVGVIVGIASGVPALGLLAAVGVGAAKELYDFFSARGVVELGDLLATAMGGLAGMLVSMLRTVN